MTKITIITTVLNNKDLILDSINCIKNQSYKNIQHIIIDGGSTDGTYELLNNCKNNYNFDLIQKKTTIYEAINIGIRNSVGEVIGILHSDDVYQNDNVIQKIIEEININKYDVVYGNLYYVSSENQKIRNWISGPFTSFKIETGWMPPHPTLFIKKKFYDMTGLYDEKFEISSDYDHILKIFKQDKIKIGYINEHLVRMRIGGKSNKSFSSIKRKMQEDYIILRNYSNLPLFIVLLKNLRKLQQFWRW